MKAKYYIIGDPAIRAKIRYWLRLAGMCIVIAFACIGFGATLAVVCQLSAW